MKEKQNIAEKLVLDMCALFSLQPKKKDLDFCSKNDDTFRTRRNVNVPVDRSIASFLVSKTLLSVCLLFSSRAKKKKGKVFFYFGGAREPNAHKEA